MVDLANHTVKEQIRTVAPKLLQIVFHSSAHHQHGMVQFVTTRSGMKCIKKEEDKEILQSSWTKRKRQSGGNNDWYCAIQLQHDINNQQALLAYLNQHFLNNNDGNNYETPEFVSADVAGLGIPDKGIPCDQLLLSPESIKDLNQ